MKLNYSEQANILIKALKDFDRADFEAWYLAHLPIGNKTIFDYLLFKDTEAKKHGNFKFSS